ncbi:hypothetical protein [Aliikangiella sp. G2MR2-5]|uniref:hypothetical protein n=1 Tax=Aliikangiella sp. G2MR2-5 TaxID=2788943 RepID=UPI0018AA6115|nr:hypothetical protein [Aliikangiella sp. G2MR2-5]
MPNLLRLFLWFALSGMLLGCGYQLRGSSTKLKDQSIFVQADVVHPAFKRLLEKKFGSYGSQLVGSSDQANRQLQVISLEFFERGVSRDETGRASEAALSVELSYYWLAASESIENSTLRSLSASTTYTFDYRDPVSKRVAHQDAQEWLYDQLAESLLAQLNLL